MRVYMNARYHRRRVEALELLGGKCCRCGSTENLEFDHVDPKKKTTGSDQMMILGYARFRKELALCQLLCQTCHSLKTLADNNKKPAKGTHGTLSSVRYCNCDLCRGAKQRYNTEYSRMHGKKIREKARCGTRAAYLRGCKCAQCRAANAEYTRTRSARKA